MKKIISVVVFTLLYVSYLYSGQQVVISGNDTAYAGTEIIFQKYTDQITNAEELVGACIADSSGCFSVTFEIDEITFVFAYVGIYKIHLYAVPGSNYKIIMPPRLDKEPGDFLNPYFSPTIIHLGTVDYNENELNTLIRMFNDAFLPYYNKHILDLRENDDFSQLDKDIARMEKSFSGSENLFFNNYRKYRYGLLRHLAAQQKSRSVSDEYFMNQPVLNNNTAYMELFDRVYDNYFHHFARTSEGKGLGEAISSGDLNALRKSLSSDKVLKGKDLLDMVILKGLYDEFYDDNYSRSAMLKIVEQMIQDSKNSAVNKTAEAIRRKTTRLLVGYEPPAFELFDRDSNLVSLESLKGKYVYLNFCSCFSYTCLNEFEMLKILHEKHKDLIQILTVVVDNDIDVLDNFLRRSNYPWLFLHYGNHSSIIKEYDVRAFPTYYLIDSEGKLAISPSPSPGEEFEARFFKLLRSRGEL
ncbi:MAG: TlpA family protein disulfide reductase [Bacteroidales bacterium]|nr:TlpA family protein disulfide reductase [Bacteroidales bacterium]